MMQMSLLPCRSSRSTSIKAGYEPLMDEQELEIQQERRSLIFPTVATAVLLLVACLIAPDTAPLRSSPKHTTPTLLSVVNHETGFYINALENPLYEQLKGATIITDSRRSWKTPPVISVDREVLGLRDPLRVSWTHGVPTFGYPAVQEHDVLALYCPATDTHFQEAATIAQIRATSAKHGGTDREENAWYLPEFPIFRATTCQFRLFAHDGPHHQLQLLAASPTIHMPLASKTPHSIHMSYSDVPSELVVEFVTGEPGSPVAMFGSNATTMKVEGTSHTYTADAMCQAPANLQEVGKFQPPGYLHVVRLTGLELDTVYEYKVGLASGQGIVWSDVFSFRSAPAVGDPAPFTYIAYGDQGCPSVGWGNGGLWISAMAAREEGIRAVHHFGDLSYARGAAHIWDDWFAMLQAFSTRIPLHVGVGNHEYDHVSGGENGKDPSGVEEDHGFMPEWGNYFNDSGGECAVPTSQRFTMPASIGSNGVFWYSHDYASVHTVMLSSEHNLTEGSPQHSWLRADLEAVNRTLTPWIVAEFHRPMYEPESQWDNIAVSLGMQFEFEDLLFDHQVDLVLTGHYHAYFRSCDGLYRSTCHHQGAPTHITVGSAGAHLDENVTLYKQEWTAKFIAQEYGYGRITVVNATAMHWEFVRAGADNDTDAGAVLDEVWILRERSI
jgi:acid phosphatase type 7